MADIQLVRATQADVPAIMEIMARAHKNMADPKMYITDTEEYVSAHIDRDGFVLLAQVDGLTAGFFMVCVPGLESNNLGYFLGYSEEKLQQVAMMDSVAVLPEYQGLGLMGRMMAEAVRLTEREYPILLATVAPDNWPSRKNAEKQGFAPLLQIEKDGGYVRLLVGRFREIPG